MTKEVATTQQSTGLVERMGNRYGIDGRKLFSTLKQTAFRVRNGEASNEQMMALLVVADQYRLNPFTREIYAFPDKHNGIVPVVGVDGWSRIINEHPEFDGMDFEYDDDAQSVTCRMHRKDRSHPVAVTEYMAECRRNTAPWQSHPRRMLRHKAMIQCARLAFGFAGIYDQDEAESIAEHQVVEVVDDALPEYPEARFAENLTSWKVAIEKQGRTADEIIAMIGSRYELTEQQTNDIRNLEVIDGEEIENETA